jgi:hypothetical protein
MAIRKLVSFRKKSKQSFTLTDNSVINQFENAHGINWWVTGLFIVGEMAGGGLVAMPTALINASKSLQYRIL